MFNPVKWIKSQVSVPSAETIAQMELEDAKRRLLEAYSAREYAEAMVQYHSARVERLSQYVKGGAA